jgi:DNA-binding MarR family transcriptional regulator
MKTATLPVANTPAQPLAMPQGCTHLQLRKLARRVSQHYDQQMAVIGLKTTQYSLLSHVVKLGPLRPSDLALALGMEPSTLTRNLRPLMAEGWVVLGAGSDGRSRLVSATPAGRAKRDEAKKSWKGAQTSLNQTLGVARVVALHTMIEDCLTLLSGTAETGD